MSSPVSVTRTFNKSPPVHGSVTLILNVVSLTGPELLSIRGPLGGKVKLVKLVSSGAAMTSVCVGVKILSDPFIIGSWQSETSEKNKGAKISLHLDLLKAHFPHFLQLLLL